MFNPLPTSAQLAQHDAWLDEAQKEPTYPTADKSARIRYHDAWLEKTHREPAYPAAEPEPVRTRSPFVCRAGKWLVSIGLRLQARYEAQVPPVRETSSSPTIG